VYLITDLKAEHGDQWLSIVETVGRQYAFIKFDRIIHKKRRDYNDPNSVSNTKKLTDDLCNIQDVMR
jgi:vesicle transport protein SEC22